MLPLANPLREEKPFEINAWAIITSIGCARMLKDIIQDLFLKQHSPTNLLIDVPVLAVFIMLLVFILRGQIKTVPLWVGFVLLIFAAWSFIRLGGVEGSSEYNFMALGVAFALCYRGKELVIILSSLFVVIVFINLDQMVQGRITTSLFRAATHSYDSYFTSMFAICVVLLIFKGMLKRETRKVRQARELIAAQHALIRRQHEELRRHRMVLVEATRRLHEDVQGYDDDIRGQDEALNNYIYLSTQNLRLSMSRMKSAPGALLNSRGLTDNLKDQIDELNLVVANLITNLEKTDHDHRN
ncbi:hypothetical protein WBG78_03520 [Chryseolinea sp. T2]|uniref:hypothetical protein n=1 Tax=Chryseolinea sp. T2 TaxID=3129255 RepID=UPI003077390F